MNAQIKPPPSLTSDRRRATTLRDIGNSLGNLKLDLHTKLPTLGNRDAHEALLATRDRLDAEMRRLACLADEFLELAQREEEEDPDAEEREWNRLNNAGMP